VACARHSRSIRTLTAGRDENDERATRKEGVVDTVHRWRFMLEATTTTSPSKAGITGMSGEV